MRRSALVVALAGLALCVSPAMAQDKKPETKPADKPATQPAEPINPQVVQNVAPVSVPVPDGPVVKKTELEGGVIAEDITIGTGYEVQPGGAVVAHYHGTLKADPTKVFDSSFNRGEPAVFPLDGVIKGWQIGVPGMKVGGVRRLTIPAALAYGEQSPSPDIPANSDLVFVVQLVDAMQIIDIEPGTDSAEAVAGQCVAVTAHTIKDADGKTLDACDSKLPHVWFPGEFAPVEWGLHGMKPGGKRKIIVPKQFNLGSANGKPDWAQNVPLEIEVNLITARNLPARQR